MRRKYGGAERRTDLSLAHWPRLGRPSPAGVAQAFSQFFQTGWRRRWPGAGLVELPSSWTERPHVRTDAGEQSACLLGGATRQTRLSSWPISRLSKPASSSLGHARQHRRVHPAKGAKSDILAGPASRHHEQVDFGSGQSPARPSADHLASGPRQCAAAPRKLGSDASLPPEGTASNNDIGPPKYLLAGKHFTLCDVLPAPKGGAP